jgi:hypothetical protein
MLNGILITRHGIPFLGKEIHGVLLHEIVHALQNRGEGKASVPNWISSGIRDYFRARISLMAPDWNRGARGGSYTSGYSTTAFFLEWIAIELCPDIVSRLNESIGEKGYNQEFFKTATGHTIVVLWQMYQSTLVGDVENDIPSIPEFPSLEEVSFSNENSDTLKLETVFEFENNIPEHPGSILFMKIIKDAESLTREFSLLVVKLLYGNLPQFYPSYISKINIILRDMPVSPNVLTLRRE